MIEFIELYRWTIPAGAIFGSALALLGCQIAARERVLQTFCISQSVLVGVLAGLGLMAFGVHHDPETHLMPLGLSMGFSIIVYFVTEMVADRIQFSKNTFFATVFAVLLSIAYLVSVLFPSLESHMANMFFGDLATLTEFDSKVTLVTGVVASFILIRFWKPITSRSFDMAIYGEKGWGERKWQTATFFLLAMFILCYSVQFLGFLFTISMLFVPTTVFALDSRKGIRVHLWRVGLIAGTSSVLGFLLSLWHARLPTTPTICLLMTFLALGWLVLEKMVGPKRIAN